MAFCKRLVIEGEYQVRTLGAIDNSGFLDHPGGSAASASGAREVVEPLSFLSSERCENIGLISDEGLYFCGVHEL